MPPFFCVATVLSGALTFINTAAISRDYGAIVVPGRAFRPVLSQFALGGFEQPGETKRPTLGACARPGAGHADERNSNEL